LSFGLVLHRLIVFKVCMMDSKFAPVEQSRPRAKTVVQDMAWPIIVDYSTIERETRPHQPFVTEQSLDGSFQGRRMIPTAMKGTFDGLTSIDDDAYRGSSPVIDDEPRWWQESTDETVPDYISQYPVTTIDEGPEWLPEVYIEDEEVSPVRRKPAPRQSIAFEEQPRATLLQMRKPSIQPKLQPSPAEIQLAQLESDLENIRRRKEKRLSMSALPEAQEYQPILFPTAFSGYNPDLLRQPQYEEAPEPLDSYVSFEPEPLDSYISIDPTEEEYIVPLPQSRASFARVPSMPAPTATYIEPPANVKETRTSAPVQVSTPTPAPTQGNRPPPKKVFEVASSAPAFPSIISRRKSSLEPAPTPAPVSVVSSSSSPPAGMAAARPDKCTFLGNCTCRDCKPG
jgi:hypothetical protein